MPSRSPAAAFDGPVLVGYEDATPSSPPLIYVLWPEVGGDETHPIEIEVPMRPEEGSAP